MPKIVSKFLKKRMKSCEVSSRVVATGVPVEYPVPIGWSTLGFSVRGFYIQNGDQVAPLSEGNAGE